MVSPVKKPNSGKSKEQPKPAEEFPTKIPNVDMTVILNDDCLLKIFSFLPYSDRFQVEKVSMRWQDVGRRSWKEVSIFAFTPNVMGLVPIVDPPNWYPCNPCDVLDKRTTLTDTHELALINNSFISRALRLSSKSLTEVKLESGHLTIDIAVSFPDGFFRESLTSCYKLEKLSVWECDPCGGLLPLDFFDELPTKKLKMLDVTSKYRLEQIPHLTEILTRSPVLHTLHLVGTNITGAELITVLNKRNIKNLKLVQSELTDLDQLDIFLSECVSLEIAYFDLKPGIADFNLKTIAKSCLKMEKLHVDGSLGITDIGIMYAITLPKLIQLHVYGCQTVREECLKSLCKLQDLSLHFTRIVNDDVKIIVENTKTLEILSVCNTLFTVEGIQPIIDIMKSRTEGPILTLKVGEILRLKKFEDLPPFLRVIE